MSTPITDALSVEYPDAPMTIFREMEKLEQENERLAAALEYWVPTHEPLAFQVDPPSLVHKSQWHSAHALLAARKEKV